MASDPKVVQVLSEHEQRKSIKGMKKKVVVKNTLESPFSLDWPAISDSYYDSLRNLLQKSCSGLKPPSKPPWKELRKFKKEERKCFLEEYEKQILENIDAGVCQRSQERKEAMSHLVMGYNQVMRAMEREEIVAVLAKKNVHPGFLIKTFLPGCANKGIPLVALYGLDVILQSDKTLGLKHHCMVIGLRPSVKETSCRFNQLYVEMCKAVQLVEGDMEEEDAGSGNEVDENEEDEMETEDKENKANTPAQYPLTEEQIESYHLKRINKKERIFIPGQGVRDQKTQGANLESDFLSFGTLGDDLLTDTNQLQLSLRPKKEKRKPVRMEKKPPQDLPPPQEVNFDNMFLIDEEGDQHNQQESEDKVQVKTEPEDVVIKKEAISEITEEKRKEVVVEKRNDEPKKEKKGKQGKKKGEETKYHPYVSAKKKRIKNNPNRKQS
ncbi:uncharacterized protein LOC125038510 [Penaeus chinensis]|uniref:uncharacterized protein LOC125038510 n=1 Tax=Penaeus chinensis TaxID=139456 RepID=UPI001FB68147|nr:uncharacterized protein LOC125038510 [Penaeus chinensis]